MWMLATCVTNETEIITIISDFFQHQPDTQHIFY